MVMGKEENLCWAFLVLLITTLLSDNSFQLIDAQPYKYNPVANLSTSWTNNDSVYVSGDSLPLNSLQPILVRSYFVCGFWCVNSRGACLFAILLSADTYVTEPQLVWSANRDSPVRENAILRFTQNGDLILENDDGSFVWSTNTGGKSVSGLNLTEEGNLVLYDKNNEKVWQSFDQPTDSLVPGQKLVLGNKLTASASASNWSRGLFSLAVRYAAGLVAYIESDPPQYYFEEYFNWTTTPSIQFVNGNLHWLSIPNASAGQLQFMKLESDGHLKVYEWKELYYNWMVVADLLASNIGVCGYPLACGKYGICSDGQCYCPEDANRYETRFFRQTNYRIPNQGCTPITAISCDHSQYHSLMELQNTAYFSYQRLSYNENPKLDNKTDLEGCKKACLNNCSCRVAQFIHSWNNFEGRGCLLISEVFSLVDTGRNNENISVFLKVQNPQKKSRRVTIILGSSLGAFFGVFLMAALCFFLYGREKEAKELYEIYLDQVPGMAVRFSYEDLTTMTNDFSTKLGEGGFGSVFEGMLRNGTQIAVKRLHGLGQVEKPFLSEVETIGGIHHVNLVRLIGFCAERTFRLLVYEYMSNGSLDKWIFDRHKRASLGWQSRRKIILDIAKGLAYLHEDCSHKIFHLDIKPQNILLDDNLNARISDFGLSKLIDKDQSQVITALRGTPGYMAPEWLTLNITEKVDVYSFGVVVLEILCGRKNLDRSQPEEDMHLLSLLKRKAEEGRLEDIIDEDNDEMRLHEAEVIKMMRVAMWCLQSDFPRRPSMSAVAKVLEGLLDVETNLDYNFTTPRRIADAAHKEDDALGVATQLLPSALSGPR
ncbi:G-type lectin S-receptor-like serine/threonine-protein kinase [Actinidia chinensis var. chinensis]|uniref:Receptor-like serine/threonine-protein kinase n=1 Tax=Actinidia chinensis var. chinensis TaxID=1590841 RepID=A0A2R6QBX6_ACTCC|nr:G-type lectin S-receptor-like serine/threonine-protein kinase [Actinidia chinensis var. chinensis]